VDRKREDLGVTESDAGSLIESQAGFVRYLGTGGAFSAEKLGLDSSAAGPARVAQP
jgi:hypothetical protein